MSAVVPVFRGEFGLMVRYHVPTVYAMGPGLTIEIEEGNEALYPLAGRWEIVSRLKETTPEASERRGNLGRPKVSGPQARFLPEPHVRQQLPEADVVIAPRRRHFASAKNWGGWPELARGLRARGLRVFAGGVADASDRSVACPAAWDYPRELDATIQAMRSARLTIATDAGLAHLAVLCGCPLLLVTYRGLVSPGPVVARGKVLARSYWEVRFDEYYAAANHTGAPIEQVDGWARPESVVDAALRMLSQEAVA